MFGRRRAASAQRNKSKAREADMAPAREAFDGGHDEAPSEPGHRRERTLETVCTCGHPRRDHTGMRMEANGRCLRCACERFMSADDPPSEDEEILQRMRAMIERVESIQSITDAMRSHAGRVGAGAALNGRERGQALDLGAREPD
jgi:hypothetical protein